ncbi:hypothetical protein ACJIZ3_020407 [Penstemon smallii]|uniref:LETM1-like protein n=1 Tax=Penstemon smallii TaxID=265156 RepID=A0ABD3SIR3_9LAMI
MASNFSLRSSHFCNSKGEHTLNYKAKSPSAAKVKLKDPERHGLAKNTPRKPFLLTYSSVSLISSKLIPPGALSSMEPSSDSGQITLEDEYTLIKPQTNEMEFNRVNCLVWVLHESSRSFSLNMETLELARTGPSVAMAWTGVDVHAWYKHLAYQVAVYALVKAALEVELLLSHNRCNNPSRVHKVLSLNINFLGDHIESQFNKRNPQLVKWFRMVEFPRIAGLFMPLFKKWSIDYAGSGVAGKIMAITCCAAIGKLGSGRISCSLFSNAIEDTLIELMSMAHELVSVDKLHQLATEAGFEEDFLSHFGSKILPSKNIEDIESWIGLVQRKLSLAFQRESVTKDKHIFLDKVQENSLATLGLFAYLGRESRLFLSRHNIKDLNEQIKDFLSYLECGILFIYPEFSTLSEYQLLMEVIIDEIGWLDFYAAYNCSQLCQDRKRSKHHPIQAEQEIILYAVFTVCYDVISGYAHYSSSTQQALDADLLEFLLQSQGRLSSCLEDYWAAYDPAYDRISDLQRIGERNGLDSATSILMKNAPFIMEARPRPEEMRKREKHQQELVDFGNSSAESSKPIQQSFIRKSTVKIVAASVDVWMGTQLLFVDISNTLRLIMKKLYGCEVTKRERRKMQRTAADIATLIPVTILMLLPVSAVGHAAMFAAINRYMPFLIPSPFSGERLNLVKQLKRTKKMEVQRNDNEDSTNSKIV